MYICVIAIFKRPAGDLAPAFVLHQWLLLARRLWFRPMPGSCECLQLHAGGAKLEGFVLVSALTFLPCGKSTTWGIYREYIYMEYCFVDTKKTFWSVRSLFDILSPTCWQMRSDPGDFGYQWLQPEKWPWFWPMSFMVQHICCFKIRLHNGMVWHCWSMMVHVSQFVDIRRLLSLHENPTPTRPVQRKSTSTSNLTDGNGQRKPRVSHWAKW
jgi:hypothetical protein